MQVRTLWFKKVSGWDEPLFDFVGRLFSARQLLYLFAIFVVDYFAASAVPIGLLEKAAVFIVILFALSVAFLPRGRIMGNDQYIIALVRKRLRRKQKPAPKERAPKVPAPAQQQRSMSRVEVGTPIQISGVVRDPSTGKPVPQRELVVTLNGQPYYSGKSGEDGSYQIVYMPLEPGLNVFEVKLDKGRVVDRVEIPCGPVRTALQEKAAQRSSAPAEEKKLADRIVYEITPFDFEMLPEEAQLSVFGRFGFFLSSLRKEVRVDVVRDTVTVTVEDSPVNVDYRRYFMSCDEPLEAELQAAGLAFRRVEEVPPLKIVGEFRGFCALEGGSTIRTFTVAGFPMFQRVGYLSDVCREAERVVMRIRPVSVGDAARKVERKKRLLKGLALYERRRGRAPEAGMGAEVERLEQLERSLSEGNTRLFEMMVNVCVGGKNKEEAKQRTRATETIFRGHLIPTATLGLMQAELARGELGTWFHVDTETAGANYPLSSAEIMEPGGMFLGLSNRTGAPVLYNTDLRENPSAVWLGKMGGGKSMSMKISIRRFAQKNPDLAFYILDPENEYPAAFALLLQPTVVELTPDRELGLDPLVIFNDKLTALALLERMLRIPEEDTDAHTELEVNVARCKDIHELYRVAKHTKKYIGALLKGPNRFIVSGKPLKFGERMIFAMKDLRKSPTLGSAVEPIHIVSMLIMGKIWEEIERMPMSKPKLVGIDEAWIFTTLPPAAGFLDSAARQSRKRNVSFYIATQKAEDILKTDIGRTICQNVGTKFILMQDRSAAEEIMKAFDLTEIERAAMTEFPKGVALVLARGIRTMIYFYPTPLELELFKTGYGRSGYSE